MAKKESGKLKKIITALVLLALSFGILWFVQRLLMQKYQVGVIEGSFTEEYYKEKVPHDILIFGDCDAYENFSPIKMYEDYGISSYIRGSGEQYMWQSYYLLRDSLRIETPKIVVLSIHNMQNEYPKRKDNYNRMTLDGMKWSKVKYNAIKASMTDEETVTSYVFPLLRFHSRWSELRGEDFKYMFRSLQLSHNGYVMRVDTKPVTELPQPVPRADYSFSETDWYWLNKMKDLCTAKGIKLVLIKSGSCYPHWFDEWDKQIVDYAEKDKLTYINFLQHQSETGIDYTKDTFDAGLHLNLSGAEKSSRWFGTFLKDMPGVTDRRDDKGLTNLWNAKIDFYEAMKASQYKQLEETGKVTSYR